MVALLGAVALWAHTNDEYFYSDDWANLALARQYGVGWELLRESYFGSFAPGHRMLDWTVMRLSDASWTLARALLLTFYAGSVVAFWGVVRELPINQRWALLATGFFATAVPFARSFQWFATGAHSIPSTFFTLVAMWAFLRWVRTRAAWCVVLTAAAQGGALMFYAKALLTPIYAVLLWFLVLKRGGGIRERALTFVRGAPIWAAVALPTLAYAVYVRSAGRYYVPDEQGTATQWLELLPVGWLYGVAPIAVAQNNPTHHTGWNVLALVLAQIVCIALIAASARWWKESWRGWVFLALAAVPNFVLVGIGRMGVYGPGVVSDLRYETEFTFLLPIAALIAFSHSRGPLPALSRFTAWKRPLIAAGVAAYLASWAGTLNRLENAWTSETVRVQAANIRADAARLRETGRRPAAINTQMNVGAVQFIDAAQIFPELSPDVPVNTPSDDLVIVAPDGHLLPARHFRAVVLRPGSPTVRLPAGTGPRSGTACFRGETAASSIIVERSFVARRPPEGAAPWPVVLRLGGERARTGFAGSVYIDRGEGFPPLPDRRLDFSASGRALTDLPAEAIRRLRIDIPAGREFCLRALTISQVRPRVGAERVSTKRL